MIRIASGTTDQYVYFYAGNAGLTNFTVYRARNGGTATAMTTPTVSAVDAVNMVGWYQLLLDEDMTIGAGNATEHMIFYIIAGGTLPITVEIELFDPDYEVNLGKINGQTITGDGSGTPFNV